MYRTAIVQIEQGPKLQCVSSAELALHQGDLCIVDDAGRFEFGRVACLEEVEGELPDARSVPRILRRATLQDQAKADENTLMGRMAMKTCRAAAERHGMKIDLVQGRYSFDRATFTVLFTSEERVDVKELVKELAGELRVRVELRQIGVRDQAGIVGGIGPCGRLLCCCTWLRRFESINVRMAKVQGLSLNPSVIGGACGRLKCCLAYEFAFYKEAAKLVPTPGARVAVPDGEGCVVDRSVLRQRVKVQLDDGRLMEYDAGKVREIAAKEHKRREPAHEDSSAEWSEPESLGEAGTADLWDDDAGRDRGQGEAAR